MMKGVKIIFALAGIALIGALGCLLAFFFVPGQQASSGEEPPVIEEPSVEEETIEAEDYQKLAETEVKRFLDTYGMEISVEEMLKQLQIRKEYEETYGKSYELEEVFLTEQKPEEEQGDPGSEKYTDTIELIQKYIEKYNIDESRYASMTAQEELAALEVEYGPLTEEAGESVKAEESETDQKETDQ